MLATPIPDQPPAARFTLQRRGRCIAAPARKGGVFVNSQREVARSRDDAKVRYVGLPTRGLICQLPCAALFLSSPLALTCGSGSVRGSATFRLSLVSGSVGCRSRRKPIPVIPGDFVKRAKCTCPLTCDNLQHTRGSSDGFQ